KMTKRKKKAQQEDFKKQKLKVGKAKPKASNFTNTSFKSRAISLPNQSITEDKSNLITNTRKLSLSELLTQLRHYNSRTRKDAIQGLGDLFHAYPNILSHSLSISINSLVRLISDEDRTVRKTLVSFFNEFIPKVEKAELRPFIPLLILFTCSAMSSIHEDIRIDSIKFMNIWLTLAPDIVVDQFWEKVLPNYISLLSNDSNLSSNNNINMMNIANFDFSLSKSLFNNHGKFWSNEVSDSDNNKRSKNTFLKSESNNGISIVVDLTQQNNNQDNDLVVQPPPHPLTQTLLPYLYSSNESCSGGGIHYQDTSTVIGRVNDLKNQLNILHSILLSLWLDTVPSVFSSTSTISYSSPALQMLLLVLKTINLLWKAYFIKMNQDSTDKQFIDFNLKQILKHFLIYFPFGSKSSLRNDSKEDEDSEEDDCDDYSMKSSFSTSSLMIISSINQELKAEHLTSLLSTIWCLLNHLANNSDSNDNRDIPDYKGTFRITKNSSLNQIIHLWALNLPKLLCELRLNNLEITKNILSILCEFAKRGGKGIFNEDILLQIQTAFVPFLYINSPPLSSNSSSSNNYGPFISLPESLQRKTIEFIFHCSKISDEIIYSLEQIFIKHCNKDIVSLAIRNYANCLLKKSSKLNFLISQLG
ncbi:976_t:CDS:10, partial [Entrophospora sp. SA101]